MVEYKATAYLRLSKEEFNNEKMEFWNGEFNIKKWKLYRNIITEITRLNIDNNIKCIYIGKEKEIKLDYK